MPFRTLLWPHGSRADAVRHDAHVSAGTCHAGDPLRTKRGRSPHAPYSAPAPQAEPHAAGASAACSPAPQAEPHAAGAASGSAGASPAPQAVPHEVAATLLAVPAQLARFESAMVGLLLVVGLPVCAPGTCRTLWPPAPACQYAPFCGCGAGRRAECGCARRGLGSARLREGAARAWQPPCTMAAGRLRRCGRMPRVHVCRREAATRQWGCMA